MIDIRKRSLKEQRDILLHVLLWVLDQNCSERDPETRLSIPDRLDSGYIRAHAVAMDILHDLGYIKIDGDQRHHETRGRGATILNKTNLYI